MVEAGSTCTLYKVKFLVMGSWFPLVVPWVNHTAKATAPRKRDVLTFICYLCDPYSFVQNHWTALSVVVTER